MTPSNGVKSQFSKRVGPWSERRRAIIAVVALMALASLGSSASLRRDDPGGWFAELCLNLGFLAAGLLAAYWIGERLIEDAERSRWASVEQAIERRSIRAAMTALSAFMDAPTLRSSLMMASPNPIPPYASLVAEPSTARDFATVRLLPAVTKYTALRPPPHTTINFTGFSTADWNGIQRGMERGAPLAAQTIMLFGERPAPPLQSAMLDLDDRLARYLDIDNLWGRQRSGQGEMAYEVQKLIAAEDVARAAMSVLDALAARDWQRADTPSNPERVNASSVA